MAKKGTKGLAFDILADIVGGLLIACGIHSFALTANVPLSGVSGICLILYRFFGLPIGLGTILMNIPVALLCFRLLGKTFFAKSLKSMLITSMIIDLVGPRFPVYTGERMLAVLCAGVLFGIGYSLIYMRSSSTGGSDFIIMSIKALRPHMSIGTISFMSDGMIIFIGGLLFSDANGIIFGMIMAYVTSFMVDKVLYGMDQGKLALIVTGDGKTMSDAIEARCGRGATLLSATGSHTGHPKQVVMCACDNKQMFAVQQCAKQVDPNAFVIILESNEVLGEGFKEF